MSKPRNRSRRPASSFSPAPLPAPASSSSGGALDSASSQTTTSMKTQRTNITTAAGPLAVLFLLISVFLYYINIVLDGVGESAVVFAPQHQHHNHIDAARTTSSHCPLHDAESVASWAQPASCYWSQSYTEARDKFRALGSILKKQMEKEETSGARIARGLDKRGIRVLRVEQKSWDLRWPPRGRNAENKAGGSGPADSSRHTAAGAGAAGRGTRAGTSSEDSESEISTTNTIDTLTIAIEVERRRTVAPVDVVHSCGTHGAEAFAGSAIQLQFLHELVRKSVSKMTSFVATEQNAAADEAEAADAASFGRLNELPTTQRKFLFVHVVNPFGMRHYRRFNENNVDLMRNALTTEMATVALERDPNATGYEDLNYLLNPYDLPGDGYGFTKTAYPHGYEFEYLTETAVFLRIACAALVELAFRGFASMKRSLVAAQYHRPKALWYGGRPGEWEASLLVLKQILEDFNTDGSYLSDFGDEEADAKMKRRLQADPGSSGSYPRPRIWVDVHTGLGRYGEYVLLPAKPGVPRGKQRGTTGFAGRTTLTYDAVFGASSSEDESEPLETSFTNEVSEGYDQTLGTITGPALCPNDHSSSSPGDTGSKRAISCLGVVQEFGTRPGIFVALALIMENRQWSLGRGSRRPAGGDSWWLRSAFNPQRWSWRDQVLRGGDRVLKRVLRFELSNH